MVRNIFTKTKKAVFVASACVFTLLATAHATTSNETYILNGASQATIISVVQNIGGKVDQNIELTSGVSVTLSEEQVQLIKNNHPLIRVNNAKNETAAIVWPKRTKKTTKKVARVVETKHDSYEVAAIVWPKRTKKTTKKTA